MTEETIENQAKPTPVRLLVTKSPRRKGRCSCDVTGEMATGSLPTEDGEGFLNYKYCSECMEVLYHERSYKSTGPIPQREAPVEPETKTKDLEAEINEVTEVTKVSETEQEPKQEAVQVSPEPELELDTTTKEEEFIVTQVTPVEGKADHMNFVCQSGGRFFIVTVPSTQEKVAKALMQPTRIVGKKARISFSKRDVFGSPADAKVLAVS